MPFLNWQLSDSKFPFPTCHVWNDLGAFLPILAPSCLTILVSILKNLYPRFERTSIRISSRLGELLNHHCTSIGVLRKNSWFPFWFLKSALDGLGFKCRKWCRRSLSWSENSFFRNSELDSKGNQRFTKNIVFAFWSRGELQSVLGLVYFVTSVFTSMQLWLMTIHSRLNR